ncbi:MAG: helix-turn-helix domain-containing protein [Deltaproteobacteria bacterium]|nr:helix-turn-helix domain-containing protein [Deltaproteobacteria bacterium]
MSKLFEGLKESVMDAGKFFRGEDVSGMTLHTVNIRPLEKKTGKDLKKLRERFGLSQGVLAEIVGVSRKTVESWEHGGVSSKPVARILQLIEADPKILGFLVEEKHKSVVGNM